MIRVLIVLICAFLGFDAQAHEVRPAYLEIREQTDDRLSVRFRQPIVPLEEGRMAGLNLVPEFSEGCTPSEIRQISRDEGYFTQRYDVTCLVPREERRVTIEGLTRSLTDVYVTYVDLDETSRTALLNGRVLSFSPGDDAPPPTLAYFEVGVHHMLGGIDHVLFVIGLILLVPSLLRVITVATTFTIAHSLTLGLSVLDLVRLPSGPVEAGIALSVLYLAYELTRPKTEEVSIAARHPELIAFGFGLLHGFGFAGALGEIGLPGDQLISALFLFNVGVEAGQLLVIAMVGLVLFACRRMGTKLEAVVNMALVSVLTVGAAYFFAGAFTSLI
ncbi:MAG: HupE/UreJ family protein [Pseudomonadota bacterium]